MEATPQQAARSSTHRPSLSDLLPIVALLFLTGSVARSAYSSRHDAPTLAFILIAYADLLLLFACFSMFDSLGPRSPPEKKHKLKAVIWVLVTYLDLAFAWRVAGVMPPALAAAIWAVAALVSLGGFYSLVLCDERD